MTKQDKELIALTVKNAVLEAIQPLALKVEGHENDLHGKTGNNGIVSTTKYLLYFAWTITGGLGFVATVLAAKNLMGE